MKKFLCLERLAIFLTISSIIFFSSSMHSQTLSTTIKSTPIYSHGVELPLIKDPQHNVNVISNIMEPIHKRYLRVFLGVHNTSTTTNLDFDPSEITLIGDGIGSLHPMDAAAVREMAKGLARRQTLGIMGATMLLDFSNSIANANNQNMQVYEQMRTDDMSDAATAKIGSDFITTQKTNLLHETMLPGDKLVGFVYFDLGKNGAVSDSHAGYALNVPLAGQTYELDFAESVGVTSQRADVSSANAAPTAQAITTEASTASADTAPVNTQPNVVPAATPIQEKKTILLLSSEPEGGADIELDGNFVGQTPFQLELSAGDHTLRLTKDGFVPWVKKIHVTGGNLTIDAQMNSQMVYNVR